MKLHLKKSEFLSHKEKEITKVIFENDNVVLVSPTGSGKTVFTIEKLFEAYPKDKLVILAQPSQMLINNLKLKSGIGADEYSKDNIAMGYGAEFHKNTSQFNRIVTTYETALYYTNTDLLIMDEAHSLAGAGDYRGDVLASILDLKCKRLLITATPEIVENLPEFKKVIVTKEAPIKHINIKLLGKSSSYGFIKGVLKESSKKELIIIKYNSKDNVRELIKENPHLNCAFIFSTGNSKEALYEGQDKEAMKQIERGIIPKSIDVLFGTSILVAGISLEVERDCKVYDIVHNGGGKMYMPNPVEAVQLEARVRDSNNKNVEFTIVGKEYGYFEVVNSEVGTNLHSTQRVRILANDFKMLSELSKENYYKILKKHKLYPRVNLISSHVVIDEKLKPLNRLEIVNSFNTFGKHYSKVYETARTLDRIDTIDFFTGEELTDYVNNSGLIIEIRDQLIFALKNSISFEWLVTKTKYKNKTIESLKDIRGIVSRQRGNKAFKELVWILTDAIIDKNDVEIDMRKYEKLLDKNAKGLIVELNKCINSSPPLRWNKSLKVIGSNADIEAINYCYKLQGRDRFNTQIAS